MMKARQAWQEVSRVLPPKRPAGERVGDFREIYSLLDEATVRPSLPRFSIKGDGRNGAMMIKPSDALELNIYSIPTDPEMTGVQVEQIYIDILGAIKSQVTIPVAVKLSPFFSNFANMARKLDLAGANGLVLFNRFYQPDIELETLEVKPNILLSTPMAMRLPLRWIAILYSHIKASLAATSGIHRATDALKMLMAGADVTMLCSVLFRRGIRHISVIEQELREWMEEHEYESVSQLQGSLSQEHCPEPSAFERAQYMHGLSSYRVPSTEETPAYPQHSKP